MSERDDRDLADVRQTRLSVLLELAVAAQALADPEASVDDWLQHVSERMGCVAALWLSRNDVPNLRAAAGIARDARRIPLVVGEPWPYPEIRDPALSRWELPLDRLPGEQCLELYFGPPAPALEPMALRLASAFQTAILHRQLVVDLQRSYHELEKAQEANVTRERLAVLGEMAAVVAHEVRNPLGAIFNSVAMLKKVVPAKTDSAEALLAIVEEEANRVNHIIMDLLDFAKPGGVQVSPTDVRLLVDEVVEAAHTAGLVPPEVALETEVDGELPELPLDARLIRQALLNLVENAVQESPKTGRVLIRADVVEDRLCLGVADQGTGVTPEAAERIFEPFYTTKGSGTGLGLAIVKRAVEAHQGRVEVTSQQGGGAVFTLQIPVEPA